jgi:hypothetical protein
MQPINDPARFIAESRPELVYVTHNSGAELTIARPRMSGDSLLGMWQGASQSLALPLGDLKQVRAVRRDKTRTVVAIAGLTLVTGALVYLVTQESNTTGPNCDYTIAEQPSPLCYRQMP